MSYSPPSAVPALPPEWREVPCPGANQRGFVRLVLEDFRVTRVQAVIVDRAHLEYFDEVKGQPGRIELQAYTFLDLVVLLGCVDVVAARVVQHAWAWRGLRALEGQPARAALPRPMGA